LLIVWSRRWTKSKQQEREAVAAEAAEAEAVGRLYGPELRLLRAEGAEEAEVYATKAAGWKPSL
jgi:hypothetical protein